MTYPMKEGAGKRWSECASKPSFPVPFLDVVNQRLEFVSNHEERQKFGSCTPLPHKAGPVYDVTDADCLAQHGTRQILMAASTAVFSRLLSVDV